MAVKVRSTAGDEVERVVKLFRKKPQREAARLVLKYKDLIERAVDIREAYYILRNFVAQEASRETYQWLSTEYGYNYFAHDILVRLEAWGYIIRPPAKPLGFYIRENVQHIISDIIYESIDQFKGIIYVEKAGVAKQLAPLSEIGYIIMAGQGFPTRLMREVAKKGKLFVLHDADKSGNDIYRVFSEGAKRLKRISKDYALKWIVEHARDIGLFYDDAVRLGLDPEPEAKKYREYGLRYELQSLIKLKIRYGVENPYVAYAAYRLEKLGEDLRPRILNPEEMYARRAVMILSMLLHKKLADVSAKTAKEAVQLAVQRGESLFDGFRLRKDLLESICVKALNELALELANAPPHIVVEDSDTTIVIGGISGFSSADEFVEKFKQKYGVYKIYDLLG